MDSVYDLEWLSENIKNESDATSFFQEFNIIPKTKFCSGNHEMGLQFVSNRITWRCRKKGCRDLNFSVRNHTWLEGSKIPITKIILFIYHWAQESTSSKFCEKELKISSPTTLEFNRDIREVCAFTLLNQPKRVGGENMIVEIDHTNFIRNSNEGGRTVPDHWVFGGICRETQEVFLCTIPEITEDAIIECIKNNIEPKTTIISECRPSYKNIEKIKGYQYKHLEAKNTNYYNYYVDPTFVNTTPNTESIEDVWYILKERHKKFCGVNRKMFELYLSEFVWRRRNANENLFIKILNDISTFNSLKRLSSPLDSKSCFNLEKRKKRKRYNDESSKLQESECSLPIDQAEEYVKKNIKVASTSGIISFGDFRPPDPFQTPNNIKVEIKNNSNEGGIPKHLQSRENSSGNFLAQTDLDPLCLSPHSSGEHDKLSGNHDDVTEFDSFAKDVGKHLNSLPRDEALQLRLKLEEVIENFELQKSSTTKNSPEKVPPLCDENFIGIKMEIKEEYDE